MAREFRLIDVNICNSFLPTADTVGMSLAFSFHHNIIKYALPYRFVKADPLYNFIFTSLYLLAK